MEITHREYWTTVKEYAKDIVEAAMEENENDVDQAESAIYDDILLSYIDNSRYAIYNCYHLPILQYSDNAEYMVDNLGSESVVHALESGVNSLHAALAFWAFYADVSDSIGDILKDIKVA